MLTIKRERERLGLTQRQFAKMLDVSQSTVASWESGRTEPNLDILLKISSVFDVSINDLINKELSDEEIMQLNNKMMVSKFGDGAEVLFKQLYLLDEQHLEYVKRYVDFALSEQKMVKNNKK